MMNGFGLTNTIRHGKRELQLMHLGHFVYEKLDKICRSARIKTCYSAKERSGFILADQSPVNCRSGLLVGAQQQKWRQIQFSDVAKAPYRYIWAYYFFQLSTLACCP